MFDRGTASKHKKPHNAFSQEQISDLLANAIEGRNSTSKVQQRRDKIYLLQLRLLFDGGMRIQDLVSLQAKSFGRVNVNKKKKEISYEINFYAEKNSAWRINIPINKPTYDLA
jgi:site-specific recombinase XerD